MAQLIGKWVKSCEQCVKESRIDNKITRSPLPNPSEQKTGPEDAMQVELLQELPPAGGNEKVLTAMEVFPRYFFTMRNQSRESELATWLSTPTYQRPSFGAKDQRSYVKWLKKCQNSWHYTATSHIKTRASNWNAWKNICITEKVFRLKEGSKNQWGINKSALRSWITAQVSAVNQADCFVDAFRTIFGIWKRALVCNKHSHQICNFSKMSSNKRKWFSKTFARTQCRSTSSKKCTTIRKPIPRTWNKNNICMFFSLKQDNKEAKFPLQTLGGLDLILLMKLYIYLVRKVRMDRTQVLHRMTRRELTAPSPYATYKSRRKHGHLTWKSS